MKRFIVQMLITATLLLYAGCVGAFRYDGPYEGKVVDAETGRPLEGVVVLGVWNKVYPNVAGSSSEFYDSVEILTNKKGEFRIAGKGVLLFSNLDEMALVVYKAGYEMLGYCPWSGYKTRSARKHVQWDGDKPTFKLKKLSYKERKEYDLSLPGIEQKRQQLLTDEINKERIEFGYQPL